LHDGARHSPKAAHGRRPYTAGPKGPALHVFWLSYAFFIVYVTSLPFDFNPSVSSALEKLRSVPLHLFTSPEGRRASMSDMAQNVVLFAPFGALTILAWGRRRISLVMIAVAAVAGFVLSASVETLQLFTADRTSSLNDVVTDMAGATLGAMVAALVMAVVRRTRARPLYARIVHEIYPVIVWGAVLVLATWHPFDTTIDVGGIGSKVRAFVTDPWQRGALGDEGADAVRYALFAAACACVLRRRGVSRARSLAAAVGVVAAIGLELSQFFVASRMPGMKDAVVGIAGSSIGALLAGRSMWSARWSTLAVIVPAWLGAAEMMLTPFALQRDHRPFALVPFLGYQAQARPEAAISHAVELSLAFFPIGFALALALPRRRRWPVAAFIVVALGGVLEYLQGWVVGRYPDVTDVGVLALGAMAGVWAASHALADRHAESPDSRIVRYVTR